MKKPIFLITLFCIILACDRYPGPSAQILKDYTFSFKTNQEMRFNSGEWVSDSVKFMAINNKIRLTDSTKVLFEPVKGGGSVTVPSCYTDKNGYAYTGWKLGSGSFSQTLRAKTYDLSGDYMNSSDLVAYGFRTNAWDTLKGAQEADISGMAADTTNNETFIIINNQLYRQGERYYQWNLFSYAKVVVSAREIKIDKNGVFWINTGSGELLKSMGHWLPWKSCTRPYPENSYYYIYISNDNYIWAFAYNYPARCSKDSGQTWTDIGGDTFSNGFGDIYRLKDGSLLYCGSGCCTLYRSFDDGLSWTYINNPGNLVKLLVNDKDEIFVFSKQNSKMNIYRSTDYGQTYSLLYSVEPAWGGYMENNICRWGNFYYILVPGYGILRSADLINYEPYFVNSNLSDLYMDHNGVLMVKYYNWKTGENPKIIYYRKNSK
jgi:hypothetical protein